MTKVIGVDNEVYSLTPTITATTYTSGKCVGGLLTFATASSTATGYIQGAGVTDVDGNTNQLDLFLFNGTPSGSSTITDNSTISIATADLAKVLAVIHVADFSLLGSTKPTYGFASTVATPFRLTPGASLTGALVARGSSVWASTTSITVNLNVIGTIVSIGR